MSAIVSSYAGFLAICTLAAFCGGLAKELYDHGGEWQKHMIGSAFSCAFAGFVCAAGALHYFPDQRLLMLAFTGLVGWGGPSVLNTLWQKFVKSKVDR